MFLSVPQCAYQESKKVISSVENIRKCLTYLLERSTEMTYLYYVVGTAVVGAIAYLATCSCTG